jgi:hypothetical protein
LTRKPGQRTISRLSATRAQGDGQVALQAFTGHFQDIADAHFARSRLQIPTGAAMQIQQIASAIDQHRRRSDLLQNYLFGQLA